MNQCEANVKRDALKLIKKLTKKNESMRMLPCKCGGKRREHWYSPNDEMPEELRCEKCGFSVSGKNRVDVIRRWNIAVSK